MALPEKLKRRFIYSLVLAFLVLVALVIFGDARHIGGALRHIRWQFLPLILALAFLNYFIRFLRWHWYCRWTNIHLSVKRSWAVFFSGLAMSITPGKLGEVVKSFFIREMTGTPVSTTLPIVFAERFTDLFSVMILAGIGAFGFHYGSSVVWIVLAIVAILLVIVMNRRLAERMLRLFRHLPFLRNSSSKLTEVYEGAYRLFTLRPLSFALLLGTAAWLCECIGFFLTLYALNQPLGILVAIFIYAFSTLFGAISFLPGGLGTTEGSLAGLLLLRGFPKDLASAATLVIRAATLWFAVLVGLLFFFPNRRMLLSTFHNHAQS